MEKEISIESMNKVIAEFMDYLPPNHEPVKITVRREDGTEYESELPFCYHDSWNWLMPVVEKIESIYDDFHGYFGIYIRGNGCTVQGTKFRPDVAMPRYVYYDEVTLATKIEATHKAVYNFIIWYNQNQSPK